MYEMWKVLLVFWLETLYYGSIRHAIRSWLGKPDIDIIVADDVMSVFGELRVMREWFEDDVCGPLLASLFVLMPMSLKMMCVVFPAGESGRFNAGEMITEWLKHIKPDHYCLCVIVIVTISLCQRVCFLHAFCARMRESVCWCACCTTM